MGLLMFVSRSWSRKHDGIAFQLYDSLEVEFSLLTRLSSIFYKVFLSYLKRGCRFSFTSKMHVLSTHFVAYLYVRLFELDRDHPVQFIVCMATYN